MILMMVEMGLERGAMMLWILLSLRLLPLLLVPLLLLVLLLHNRE
jgi:hypothetical protein